MQTIVKTVRSPSSERQKKAADLSQFGITTNDKIIGAKLLFREGRDVDARNSGAHRFVTATTGKEPALDYWEVQIKDPFKVPKSGDLIADLIISKNDTPLNAHDVTITFKKQETQDQAKSPILQRIKREIIQLTTRKS